MFKGFTRLLIRSRIPKRPSGGILKNHVCISNFIGKTCPNGWNYLTICTNAQLNSGKKFDDELSTDGKSLPKDIYHSSIISPIEEIKPLESQKGYLILHEYLNSSRDANQIMNTVIALTRDSQMCGVPYNLQSEMYDEFVQDAIKYVDQFSSGELMYFASLHFHTNKHKDKPTEFLVQALKSNLKDLSLIELLKLTEMLILTNVTTFCDMRAEMILAVEKNIDEFNVGDNPTFAEMCSILRLFAYMPIKNAETYLDKLISTKLDMFGSDQIYIALISGFSLLKLQHLRVILYNKREIFWPTYKYEYSSFKSTLRKIFDGLLQCKESFNPIRMICHVIRDWSPIMPFFFDGNYLKESFYYLRLQKCENAVILMVFRTYHHFGNYDEEMVDEFINLVNQMEPSFFIINQYSDVLSLRNIDNPVNISHINNYAFQTSFSRFLTIDRLFDYVYLNFKEEHITATITEENVAKAITNCSSSVDWKEKITAAHASLLYKICLLSTVMRKNNPSSKVKLPLFLSPMVQTANKMLFDKISPRVSYSPNQNMISEIVNGGMITNVVYNNVGIIDALVILDENGFPRNVDDVVKHRSDLSYHSLNLDPNDIKIAVLNIKRYNCVMKSKHLIRWKKCLEEYLTSEGFSVIINHVYMTDREKEAQLRKQFLRAGLK